MLASYSLFFRGACSGVIGGSVTHQGSLTIYAPGPDMTWMVWVAMGLCVLAWALDHLVIRRIRQKECGEGG